MNKTSLTTLFFVFALTMIFFNNCKKENSTSSSSTSSDWAGKYNMKSSSCTVPSYQSAATSSVTIPSGTSFSFAPYSFNVYLYPSIQCTINGNTAQISSDPMSQGDANAGFNSWDFLGGTITKSGNTLTFNYSFKTYYENGKPSDNPVYTIVYQK